MRMAGRQEPYKTALKRKRETLRKTITPWKFLPRLVETRVISEDRKTQIEQLQAEGGETKDTVQATALLDNLIKKDEIAIENFVKILKGCGDLNHREIARELENDKILCASSKVSFYEESEKNEIWKRLQKAYGKEEWRTLHPIPGAEFRRDISQQDCIMKPDFCAQHIDSAYLQRLRSNIPEDSIEQVELQYSQVHNTSDILAILRDGLYDPNQEVDTQFEIYPNACTIPSHVALLTGDAGTGKTTLAHNLVWKWTEDGSDERALFKAIFLLPVKRIRGKGILDALSSIGLISRDKKDCLASYLSDPSCANKVLFILDGLDEMQIDPKSEIASLAKGKVFPGCNVLLTCRPEAKLLRELKGFFPDYRVWLQGTTDAAVEEYIRNTFRTKEADKVKYIIDNCKERLVDTSLLRIPLYLTMICCMFDEAMFRHIPVTNFTIPDTMTGVFNAFLHVILRILIQKLDRTETIKFNGCILLDEEREVPADICRVIYHVGRMAFHGLLDGQSDFTAKDLTRHFLDEHIISKLGVFSIDFMDTDPHTTGKKPDLEKIIFFRHRTLQEYFAANYLVAEGMNTKQFLDLFETLDEETIPEVEKNLFNTFQILGKATLFACGLSPCFLDMVLTKTSGRIYVPLRLDVNSYIPLSDKVVSYEISLFHEVPSAVHKDIASRLLDYFRSSKTWTDYETLDVENKILQLADTPMNITRTMANVAANADLNSSLELLKHWYHLELDVKEIDTSHWVVLKIVHNEAPIEDGKLEFTSCDLLLILLLCRFQMHSVRTLELTNGRRSEIRVPITKLLQALPNVKKLVLTDVELINPDGKAVQGTTPTPNTNIIELQLHQIKWEKGFNPFPRLCLYPSITILSISSASKVSLQKEDICGISTLHNLQKLTLNALNITENMNQIPEWKNLTELDLTECMITAEQVQKLCEILTTRSVTNLNVSRNNIGGDKMKQLIGYLEEHNKNLNHLCIQECNIMAPYTKEIFEILEKMEALYKLEICTTSLESTESQEAFIGMLQRSYTIESVEIHNTTRSSGSESPLDLNIPGLSIAYGYAASAAEYAMSYVYDPNETRLKTIFSEEKVEQIKKTGKKVTVQEGQD